MTMRISTAMRHRGLAAILMAGLCGPTASWAAAQEPSHACSADADTQRLAGAARAAFLQHCEAGRTPPIANTPRAPTTPDDPAALCKAKATGNKMTGVARDNYIRDCVRKGKPSGI